MKITKINGALFAPWLAFPLPEEIFGEDVREIHPEPENKEKSADKSPTVLRLEEITKPAPQKSSKRKKNYRTNEAQGLLFDFD